VTESLECGDLSPLFRLKQVNEKRRQVILLANLGTIDFHTISN